LTKGLRPSQDDSSRRSSLYKCSTGEIETTDQVAARLSNHENPGAWNPNSQKNGEFRWWSPVKKTKIRDITHMNNLLLHFPPSEYREVELLVWKFENG
jgi:hypothetical protein